MAGRIKHSPGHFVFVLRPHEATYRHMLRKAAEKQHECTISYERFLEYTTISLCTYCRGWLEWDANACKALRRRYNLDRVDAKKGYTPDNVVVCCPRCNMFKGADIPYVAMLEIGPILEKYDVSYRSIARISKYSQSIN